ncbi:MAG: hypothetical protein M1831_006936 [Alyxoria varia]|nr:MAG: hypothetical protein M1831_006936 [Alyxoria varia]
MDPDPPELPTALLRWVTTFNFASSVRSLKDLQDGEILWQILVDIRPDYFTGSIPDASAANSDNWIPRWQNLKHVERMVMSFIRDECGRLPRLSKKLTPDLKAIAIDGSSEELIQVIQSTHLTPELSNMTLQLVKAVLLAAMYSPSSNQRMMEVMYSLGPKVGAPIATFIGNIEARDQQLAEAESRGDVGSDTDGILSPERSGTPQILGIQRDMELEREERLIQAYSTIKNLEERNGTLTEDLKESRMNAAKIDEELADIKYRIEQRGLKAGDNEMLEELRQRSSQDKDYIAGLETELEALRSSSESQERQLIRLRGESEYQQRLRDEIQFLKTEKDDLVQRSKASENLKKKIQTLQDSEKSSNAVRQENESLREDLQKMKSYKDKCVALQKANEEFSKTIANVEQEIYDQKTTRKRLDHEIKIYMKRYEDAKDRQQRDAEVINDQEERIRDLEAGQGKATQDLGNLDDELSSKDKVYSDLSVRSAALKWSWILIRRHRRSKLSELEAENSRLKQAPETQKDDAVAQKDHESLQRQHHDVERKYLDTYQENIGLDTALKDSDPEVLVYDPSRHNETLGTDFASSRPYLGLRDRFRTEEEGRKTAEQRVSDLETELADLKVKFYEAESRLSVIDRDESTAVEELRKSNTAKIEVLDDEKTRLTDRAKNTQFELDEYRSLLRHSLMDNNALLKEDPELRTKNDFKLISSQLGDFKMKAEPTEEELALSLTKLIENGRQGIRNAEEAAAKTKSTLESQIEGLQQRLQRAQEEIAKGVTTPVQENIQRELSLMTSAWYDITSRMQSDAVIVQRRSDAPRSFLNRQRKLLSNPVLPGLLYSNVFCHEWLNWPRNMRQSGV